MLKAEAIENIIRGMILLSGKIFDSNGLVTIHTTKYWREVFFNTVNLRSEKNKFTHKKGTIEDFAGFYVGVQ